jgi:hypothetical protein
MSVPKIEAGFCQCGCGERTRISKGTNPAKGQFYGKPFRFVAGHQRRLRTEPYLVDPETGCWLWQRSIDSSTGYGKLRRKDGIYISAHRHYYEMTYGPIPKGFHVDHVRKRGCIHRHCCNPAHLEAVTPAENARRAERHKLDWDKVAQIRGLRGQKTQREIGRMFGVDRNTIGDIQTGKSWKEEAA